MYKQEKIRESFNKTENIMSVAIRSRIKEYIVPLKYSWALFRHDATRCIAFRILCKINSSVEWRQPIEKEEAIFYQILI